MNSCCKPTASGTTLTYILCSECKRGSWWVWLEDDYYAISEELAISCQWIPNLKNIVTMLEKSDDEHAQVMAELFKIEIEQRLKKIYECKD
jgi:hypothetical protein